MKVRGLVRALLLAVALESGAGSALAQNPSAQDRATARLLAEEADKKLEAGDLKGALELFQRADAIFPAPTLKLAAAHVFLKMGLVIEAHEALLDAARSEPQKGEPPSWATARDSARQEAGELAPKIPRIEVTVEGLAAGVAPTVLLDGQRLPNASLGVARPINPGPHRIRSEAEGYMPAEQKIQMGEGEHYKLALKMFPEAPAASTSASAPPPRPTTRPSGEPKTTPDTGPGGSTLAIVGFASGGAFAVVGTVFGLMVSSKVKDIKKDCDGDSCPLSRRKDADRASTYATVSNISFALAAVGVGVGVYGLFAREPAAAASSRRGPSVRLGVGFGSVALDGRFLGSTKLERGLGGRGWCATLLCHERLRHEPPLDLSCPRRAL